MEEAVHALMPRRMIARVDFMRGLRIFMVWRQLRALVVRPCWS